ncbi:Pvc16 family protein [uncultured Dokdonia sp.]|uniref:Pvc16 family protein n=1 Tax=uncultured Dokdonia sp. TaxID=575653 RepID=UPI00260A0C31|nr:Pvc16 family protein [uncultured Dokdonia sp.]
MIQEAFQYTQNVFNQYIKRKFDLDENIVVINSIIDNEGNTPLENQNKIVLSLIHIDQEITKPFYTKDRKGFDTNHTSMLETENYTIDMLVTPCFDDYSEALKFLNASIQFFQAYAVLDITTHSDFPEGLQKLSFDLQKGTDYTQMHNLWNALGAKYQPSLIYKMRSITIAS